MITARQRSNGGFRRLGSYGLVYWSHPEANLGTTWAILQAFDGTASRARRRQRARSAHLRPRRRCCSASREEDGHAEAPGGVGGAGRRRPSLRLSGSRSECCCRRSRGRCSSCQLTADARARPDDRAARWIRRRSSEQEARASTGEIDAEALKKTTLSTEPNTETLNFLNLNRNSACQLFDEMILACGKFFWS